MPDTLLDTWDEQQFRDMFKDEALFPPSCRGRPRRIAELVNESVGWGDARLYTKAEYAALFQALVQERDSRASVDVDASGATLSLTTAGMIRALPAQPYGSTWRSPSRHASSSRSRCTLSTSAGGHRTTSSRANRPRHLSLRGCASGGASPSTCEWPEPSALSGSWSCVLVMPDDAPLHDWAGLAQRLLILVVLFPCRIVLSLRLLQVESGERT